MSDLEPSLLLGAIEAWIAVLFDLKFRKVPNKLNLLYMTANGTYAVLKCPRIGAILGTALATIFVLCGVLVLYGIGFGGGDVKLMLSLSPLIGPFYLGISLMGASLIALSRKPIVFRGSYLALSLTALGFL